MGSFWVGADIEIEFFQSCGEGEGGILEGEEIDVVDFGQVRIMGEIAKRGDRGRGAQGGFQ